MAPDALILPHDGPLDLRSTLLSGQAFRWRAEDGWYKGVVSGKAVRLRSTAEGVEVDAAQDGDGALALKVRDYLSLDTDIKVIYRAMSFDGRLRDAIDRYPGMRVLRQDPWECLVSFICSSASNIPRITRNIESICESFGAPVDGASSGLHAFPAPEALAVDGAAKRMRELGLGYRADYVASTARSIADGEVDLMSLRESPYEAALEALMSLDGVGDKVANCVMLFSLDKPEAFPVDTWIDKAMREWYLGGTKLPPKKMRLWAMEHFRGYAGYANHYLFHDRRIRDTRPTDGRRDLR